jgi:sugar/nucleoside kinase (ribokinase family)
MIAAWQEHKAGDMNPYDIVFIGHISVDEIRRFNGRTSVETGGAAFYSSMAACMGGLRIAVITRMTGDHHYLFDPLKARGIDVYVQPSPKTSHLRVVYGSQNPDEREIFQTENAGFFEHDEITFPVKPRLIHLGALTDREFSVEFMTLLKARGFELSVDMQGFVRQVDAESGVIHFRDVPRKKEIIAMAKAVKLDVVEAELLTGTADLSHAARIVEEWGSPETMVTRADGVLVRAEGREYFEPFTNRSNEGRTGRGDTTFGAYLARRLDHSIEESLRFAAAVVSIKMESPGPFKGSMEEVLSRMR